MPIQNKNQENKFTLQNKFKALLKINKHRKTNSMQNNILNAMNSSSILISHLNKWKWNSSKSGGTALCPFHNDNSPSFGVSFKKLAYNCFTCGAHGHLFKLFKKFNISVGFNADIELEELDFSDEVYKSVILEDDSFSKWYSNFIEKFQNPKENPYRYLTSHNYLEYRRIDPYIREKYGIYYDNLLKAILVPIFDEKKNLLGYFRRFENPKAKQNRMLYSKDFKSSQYLFGLEHYKGQDTVLLTEGILDSTSTLVNLMELNLDKYILPCSFFSSTNLNDCHIKKLLDYNFKNVILLFDNDKAGKDGIIKVNPILNKYLRTNFYIPDYDKWESTSKDPDDLRSEELQSILNNLKRFDNSFLNRIKTNNKSFHYNR